MTPEVPLDYPSWVRFIFGGWNNWGWVGVDLFFVLSKVFLFEAVI